MNFKFEVLFSVEFRHEYFADAFFNGLTISPSDDTLRMMKRNGLVFKAKPGGFFVGYDIYFAANERQPKEILHPESLLSFRLDLKDKNLYNYTGRLPENIFGAIFHFKNFSIPVLKSTGDKPKEQDTMLPEVFDPSVLIARPDLVEDSVVSGKDVDARPLFIAQYFSKPFGQISILLHSALENNFVIKMETKATHWQYILASEHLMQLKKPAIINRSTQSPFKGPFPVQLPGNNMGIAFISEKPIALTSQANRMFSLVENYEPGNENQKVVIAYLPNPEIGMISDIPNGLPGVWSREYLNIFL